MREVTGVLAREAPAKISAVHRAKANELFESLALIEPYWALPGMLVFDHLRRRHIPLERDSHDTKEEHDDGALLSPEARALNKTYFEVLIVDDVSDQQERWLKNNVSHMRRIEDPFI